MEIKQVKIKNFRGYGINKNSYDGFFTFNDLDKYNIIILSGYNGYGKTSFYEAVEWCISDRIQRLVELDTVFKLGKTYLKNSEYLKFNGGNFNNGLVEVSLTFSDGDNEYFIRRTTYHNSFQDLGYRSQCYNRFDEEMSDEEVRKLIGVISQNSDQYGIKNNIMKSNVLGQERMNEFLRLTKPEQRTKGIFNLVGLNNITEILQLSKSEKMSNVKSLLTDIENEKIKFIEAKNSIENWFKIKGFGDFENYYEKVKNDISEINDQLKLQGVSYKNFNLEENLNEDNIIETIENYMKYNETVEKYYIINKGDFDESLKKWYLNRINEIYIKLHNIQLIKTVDLITVNRMLTKTDEVNKFYKDKLKKSESQLNALHIYVSISKTESYRFGYSKDNVCVIDYSKFEETLKVINQFYIKYGDNIIYGIVKNKEKINALINESWQTQVNVINTKISEILEKIKHIDNKKETYNKFSDVASNYNEAFSLIKEIVIREKIMHCPICKNDNFERNIDANNIKIINADNNTKLLYIIDKTISNGNQELLEIQKSITNESKVVEDLKEKLSIEVNKMLGILKEINELATEDYNSQFNYFTIQLECIKKHIEYYNFNIQELNKKIKEYDTCISDIKNNFMLNNLSDEDYLNISETIYNKLMEHYIQVIRKKYRIEIKEIISLKEMMNLIQVDKAPNQIIKILNTCKKVLQCFINLENYKMDEEERKKFKAFIALRNKITNINNIYNRIDELVKCYDNIGSRAREIEKVLIEKLIAENPLSTWIYEQINPHPLYDKFKFKINGNDTNIVYEKNESIYLDHIFSSAQLNVLALSIFLGFALMKGSSNVNQLFLDDPIQNMDDYNILSLIDVFRAITDEKINKSVIISTHDDNFKNLLALKFRNKKCKVFDYVEYDEYGPIINELN